MAGSIHEGPEFGVGDFVLLHDLTLDAFMENLKLRWVDPEIGQLVNSFDFFVCFRFYALSKKPGTIES